MRRTRIDKADVNNAHFNKWKMLYLFNYYQIHYKKERRPTALRRGERNRASETDKTQGETAGDKEETDWEEAGEERREDA